MNGRRLLFVAVLLAVCVRSQASRSVLDDMGRTVVLPDHVQRVICLAPSVADDVFSLGAGVQVVAISDFTKYPAEATRKPSIGNPGTPSLERIVALHPDVVIGTSGINSLDTVRLLERHGVPVFIVTTVGIAGVYRSIAQIGHALGRDRDATTLISSLKQRETSLREQSARRPAVRVFVPLWYDPIFTIGKSAYISELISIVGLHSVTDDIAQEWPKVSLEAVIARDPDMLLLLGDNSSTRLDKLSSMPGWNTLRAVRERKVLHGDDRLELPSPTCFDALEALARQVPVRQ